MRPNRDLNDEFSDTLANKYLEIDVSNLNTLRGKFMSIHGGYDTAYANDFPDRVAPLDILKRLANKGFIG